MKTYLNLLLELIELELELIVYLLQQVLQENEDLIQQINFTGRLTEAANIFIIIEKKEHTILEFSQNFANILYK